MTNLLFSLLVVTNVSTNNFVSDTKYGLTNVAYDTWHEKAQNDWRFKSSDDWSKSMDLAWEAWRYNSMTTFSNPSRLIVFDFRVITNVSPKLVVEAVERKTVTVLTTNVFLFSLEATK